MKQASLRFYAELNDFLAPERRMTDIPVVVVNLPQRR